MPLKQQRDDNNEIIPNALSFEYGAARKLIANTSSSNSTSFSNASKIITVVTDAPVFFEHNVGSLAPAANSTSHYLVANTPYTIKLRNNDLTSNAFVAFLAATVQANVYISPRV